MQLSLIILYNDHMTNFIQQIKFIALLLIGFSTIISSSILYIANVRKYTLKVYSLSVGIFFSKIILLTVLAIYVCKLSSNALWDNPSITLKLIKYFSVAMLILPLPLFILTTFKERLFWPSYTIISILLVIILSFAIFFYPLPNHVHGMNAAYMDIIDYLIVLPVLLLGLPATCICSPFILEADIILFNRIRKDKDYLTKKNQETEVKQQIENKKVNLPIQQISTETQNNTKQKLSLEITPLLNAIVNNDIKLAEDILIKHPEQLNIGYTENGNFPLHVAAFHGQIDMVSLLLKQPDIDINIKNKDGKTALDLAKENNHLEICPLLNETSNK